MERIDGGNLTDCSTEQQSGQLPELIRILTRMNHVKLGSTCGYGWIRLLYLHNGKKIKLFVTEALSEVLWENTLKGGMYNRENGLDSLNGYFDVIILEENQPMELFPGITLELIPTVHIPHKKSYSFFINNQIFYSADVQFNKDLLIHEVVLRKKLPENRTR
jgi:hypothetical protein